MGKTTTDILQDLTTQIGAILDGYRRMLDDEFIFGAGLQVPQAATIFERAADAGLPFAGTRIRLAELLASIAYRYGFTGVRRAGHGGYAVVLGHNDASAARVRSATVRRVLRLVPEHHVQDVLGPPEAPRPFDVRLDARHEPIRDPAFPLLLSDVFLLPRHTTKLIFYDTPEAIARAGGRPAILHCQLLPEVVPLNAPGLDQRLARHAGDQLETALATLGVRVADAHGGNGGVLIGADGAPLMRDNANEGGYIPVVLDYGYYSEIGPGALGEILARCGVSPRQMADRLMTSGVPHLADRLGNTADAAQYAAVVEAAGAQGIERGVFGRLLLDIEPPILAPRIWIRHSREEWRTAKETHYPPLRDQSRLNALYPAYDEIIFPQRIEAYHVPLAE